jgi:hypothetical protein
MSKLVRTLFLAGFAALSVNLFAATYYVDYSSGSDSNSGTSKTSPWQNAPGMQTCANTCKSAVINGGDSIILKGGVTWPNASFMWNLPGGGTGTPVYIGVDQTWYVGGAWARPVLNAGGSAIANNYDTMFNVGSNVTFDNFEITGFYWNSAACSGAPYGDCGIFNAGQRNGQTWENLYIHGWTHAGTGATSNNGVVNIIATGGGGNSVAHDNVIVGTDVPGDHSVSVFFNGPPIAYNNYIKQVSSAAIVSYASLYHDNHIEDIGPAYCNMPFPQYAGTCTHENGFEDNGDTGLYFYNNVITNVGAGLALWIAPNPGYTATLWNNVIYLIHDNQVMDLAPPVYSSTYCSSGATSNDYCKTAGTYVFENNTVECGDDSTQYDVCQSNIGVVGSGSVATAVVFQNNHFITKTTASGCATGTGAPLSCTFSSTNIVQTLSTANTQGYTSSEEYAFSPANSKGATVGAGTNLMSQAQQAMSSLSNDTSYTCTVGNGEQPSCPAEPMIGRSPSGAWDSGAFLYASSQAPQAPTGLTATVH